MTFDPSRFYPDPAAPSSSSSSSPAPETPFLRKDELAGALEGLDPPGDGATQKAVRQGLASLIGRLKSVAPAALLLLLAPCVLGGVPWEEVPPDTPVDLATVGADLGFTNDFLRVEADPTVPAWAKAAQPPTNGFLRAEADPTVPSWAKASQPPAVVEADPVFAAWRDDDTSSFAGSAARADRADVALALDDSGTWVTYVQILAEIAAATQRVSRASSSLAWASGPLALSVGASLTADLAGWPDGGAVFVRLTASGAYTVAPSVSLLGYGTWPTNSASCVAVRDGARVLVTVLEGY